MRVAKFLPTLALVCLAAVAPRAATASETEDRLVAIGKELPFISVDDFLQRREPIARSGQGIITAAWKTLLGLNSPALETAELVKLSEGPDPDIRTLAILALVTKETPDFIPVCIRLMRDNEPTKPGQIFQMNRLPGEPWLVTEPLTVGNVACKALAMVGCPGSRGKHRPNAPIDSAVPGWWAARKDNSDWLAWYEFLFQRAARGRMYGIGSNDLVAEPGLKPFMEKVNSLPPKTRAWVLLFLSDAVYSHDLRWESYYASEAEMLRAVKVLGADALVEFLKSGKRAGLKSPSLDKPQGKRFIFAQAKHLFTPAHADELLQIRAYTAAADADPRAARNVIAAGMEAHKTARDGDQRVKLMACLADLGDATDRTTVAQWFYDEGNQNETLFFRTFEQRRPREWRDLLKRIVAHPKFNDLGQMGVIYLAATMNKLAGEEAVPTILLWRGDEKEIRPRLRDVFQIPAPPK